MFAVYACRVHREDIDAPVGQRKVRGPLEAALAGGERLYGQCMAGFGLAFEARLTTLPVISGGRALTPVAPARSVGIQHKSSTIGMSRGSDR
ncbi:hypothetical protein QF034_005281 [Streptomyces africanus]|uniref:Uncharacterized protein n=1 Tax=Streptomyces africanus TaxID=231024 RepID=A0ABU0QVA2_9ACTN|nr:hypothetical protein [Streptomyces africanus]